ncbi:hypothetical protein ISF_09138 [Cordyceps fumosorosea ARSEF 2679]|uniref:Ubiquitin fusion degradation protein (Ufd1) n=1 Tax=Cordyceps fumosorosea (strain ARSEF 2679) TaxID=1081104 RepID=A0A162M9L8_CORFA|nr:hypothetical protein ISF_09138 [Cordyceps fumosorosea ARSEF 2679]OAA52970.1 hypothetical protein ISF_09138 [Cordyceps fumosorosea ARSEF 2679]
MSQVVVDTTEREGFKRSATNLLDIVHNTLVLSHIVAYLPPSSITKLTATNRAIRDTITHTPGVHRHLDLTTVKRAYTSVGAINHGGDVTPLVENLTEDDFYSGLLRGLFSTLQRRNILQDVQTLVLDGLSVTAELCHEIINDPRFNVRLLSIRDVTNLNHAKLRGALQYACRASRDANPRLKGLYLFGPKGSGASAGDAWWDVKGRQLRRPVTDEWAACVLACSGALVFDAPLCHGPRHRNSRAAGAAGLVAEHRPAVATYALAGCAGCGAAPEGMTMPSSSELPLLAPPPTTSSSVRAATTPGRTATAFVPRCGECIRERHCQCCDKWWCEACYQLPGQGGGPVQEPAVVILEEGDGLALEDYIALQEAAPKMKNRVTKSCWECGNSCEDCIDKTQRVCKKCCAGYCTVHNEGSSAEFCDWCVSRGRRLAKTKGHEGSPPRLTILRDVRHLNHIRRRAGF